MHINLIIIMHAYIIRQSRFLALLRLAVPGVSAIFSVLAVPGVLAVPDVLAVIIFVIVTVQILNYLQLKCSYLSIIYSDL